MVVEFFICIRVFVKHEPLDILTQWVWGRTQESAHLCAPQVPVGGVGSLECTLRTSAEYSFHLLLARGVSLLLTLWELLFGVCSISINFVVRKSKG